MKSFITILIIIFIQTNLWAQNWQEVDQDYFGMKYKLPEDWEIDGFGGNNWEEYGSSVCDCAGTINIGNRYKENEIYMVIYPSRNKDSIFNAKRLKIWDMEFKNINSFTMIKTPYCVFKKKISTWKENAERNYSEMEVWQLFTSYKNQFYLIYFWAKPDVMNKNQAIILQIIHSFNPVKSR